MTGAGLVYVPAFILSIYLACRSYPTRRTRLVALSAHLLASAALMTWLGVASVRHGEPGIVGLWVVIFGPGAAIALCRLLAILWQLLARADDLQAEGASSKDDPQN
ncbi:hypothetical protein [Amycolatopsis keratiniphila]|uniref:hypothetical protein n=1 Tax=Amycolatopsis keratiniphila TaxID=129921 RepID=UPI00087CD6F9|nr:hypothetical protein [Amycolatopsis keratiniphila]OLZ60356.1 hypothetical protein BS330_08520 [Amycolatopsis keratiniphila subsp. nogabecina]SDU59061.1 hypothetical protein SAMN04489733_6623 [Amycolatopsis keratiniphila]